MADGYGFMVDRQHDGVEWIFAREDAGDREAVGQHGWHVLAAVDGEIDVAVHSLKDVPSIIPEQFELCAFLERADPRDVWVSNTPIAELPAGARVGTSSPRRRAQLASRFPHLEITDIRGNVDTRIAKARSGEYAGVVLAAAGLLRLGRGDDIAAWFSVDEMVPAAGQGIVGLECLRGNASAVRAINHAPSETAALCERGVLQKFGERLDCYSEVAVHATIGEEIVIRAFFHGVRSTQHGSDASKVIDAVYEELICQARSIS